MSAGRLIVAIVKEDATVPDVDIDRAIDRQQLFLADPSTHTYEEEQPDGIATRVVQLMKRLA